MTEHEELELLKKQYEAVKKQRDDLRYCLADLIDTISSGAYNGFNLNDDKIVDHDGNKVNMFHGGLDAYIKALGQAHYFHISRLLEKMKEYNLKMDEHPHKAEISVMLENWKLPEEIEKWRNECRDSKPEEIATEDGRKEAIKALATHLVIFSHEYDFSHDYPGADRGVYSVAFMLIVRLAMQIAGIPTTPEGIENTLKEAYGVDKRPPSKRI